MDRIVLIVYTNCLISAAAIAHTEIIARFHFPLTERAGYSIAGYRWLSAFRAVVCLIRNVFISFLLIRLSQYILYNIIKIISIDNYNNIFLSDINKAADIFL